MSLGQRLKERRKALKLTQQELAESLQVTPQHISAIEQDVRAPSLPFLAKLAEELGVTVDYLVTGKEGAITDIIPAIKADRTLNLETRKALITLVRALRASQLPGNFGE
ncbi:hypothetical protein ES705_16819 [subsurface metagenome]|jgi:transcriptional regulator with XRE-family HTH domain